MGWTTIFDLSPSNLDIFKPLAVTLLVLVVYHFLGRRLVARQKEAIGDPFATGGLLPKAVFVTRIGLIIFAAWLGYQTFSFRAALAAHKGQTVEGVVTDLRTDGRDESFAVRGVSFHYLGGQMTPCFHQPASDGGPIHNGLHVRVTYLKDPLFFRSGIVRLEVAKNSR